LTKSNKQKPDRHVAPQQEMVKTTYDMGDLKLGAGAALSALARVTGLEPATSGVTGRRSNQLSYTRISVSGGVKG
jgi:hypothetical protein